MLTNNEIKNLSSLKLKKYRDKEEKFLIEGYHLLAECINSSYTVEMVILRNDVDVKKTGLNLKNIRMELLPEKTFNKLTETKNSQGVIGVVRNQNQLSTFVSPRIGGDNFQPSTLVVALDRITDPGNLGTIIRTAYWFGAGQILMSKDSVDIHNSKVIRSSQGAVFHVDVILDSDLTAELPRLAASGFQVLLLNPGAADSFSGINIPGKYVLVFGNEAEGISKPVLDLKYREVKIESFSKCESLNVAVACGIALDRIKHLS